MSPAGKPGSYERSINMEKKNLHNDRISHVSGGSNKDYGKYICPYCKYQFSSRQQRLNCPNCAREIILWDLLNRV